MAPNRPRNRTLANGRSAPRVDQYLRLTYKMLESPNFRCLSGSAVKVLFEIALHHNGYNNGKIVMSVTQLQDALRLGRQTITNALLELQACQFIVARKKGVFTGRQASEWEVTFLSTDGIPASNAWGQAPTLRKRRRRVQPKTSNHLEDLALQIDRQNVKDYIQKNQFDGS